MKKPFVVGDRVRAYNCTKEYIGVIRDIDDRREPHTLVVETSDDTLSFHPKQCRRLVKKERRRIWINVDPCALAPMKLSGYGADGSSWYGTIEATPQKGWIEFLEVKNEA